MPSHTTIDPSIASEDAIRWAFAAGTALQSVGSHLHPSWRDAVSARLSIETTMLVDFPPQCLNEALLSVFDLNWPDLSASESPIEKLWLLPPDEVARICSARVAVGWPGGMRHCVDATTRRLIRGAMGNAGFECLLKLPPAPLVSGFSVKAANMTELCTAGWRWLRAGTTWCDRRAEQLVALMLPFSEQETVAQQAPSPHQLPILDGNSRFLQLFPTLFPEHSWLSGCAARTN